MAPPERPGNGRASARRVPGLRRQELAEAAGISVEYYTRLEQGRAPRPSREILNALERAFGLSTTERELLFRLAGEHPPELEARASVIRPGLEQLLRGLDRVMPVTVHDGRLDVLAANEAAGELLEALLEPDPFGRNVAYLAFTSPKVREVVGDEGAEQLARVTTSELRMAMSRYPADASARDFPRPHRPERDVPRVLGTGRGRHVEIRDEAAAPSGEGLAALRHRDAP